MTEENTTLNTEGNIDPSVTGDPSALDSPQVDLDSDNLDNTGNDPAEDVVTDPEGAKKTEGSEGETGGEDKDKELGGQDDRFDKHPRFQELRTERDEFREKLARTEGENVALKDQIAKATPAVTSDSTATGFDMTKMSSEEIHDQFAEEPGALFGNFAVQLAQEVKQYVDQGLTQKSQATKVEETFSQYTKDNPDFDGMWKSGEITKYINAHPGHTPISAHQILTGEAKINKAVEEAVKAKEKQIMADLKVKRNAAVLGEGPSAPANSSREAPAELKDTKKHGGLNTVLAQRLARMRQAA